MTYILILFLVWVVCVITYLIWGKFHTQEPNTTTHLPKVEVKESEYIKIKRQECIERFSDKLIAFNVDRKVDLLNPTVLKCTNHQ